MKSGNGVRFSERKIFGVRRLGAAFVLDGLPSRPFYFSIKLRLTIKAILFIKKARVPLTLPSRTPKYLTRRRGGCSRSFKDYAFFASFAAKNYYKERSKRPTGAVFGRRTAARIGSGSSPPFFEKKILPLKLPFPKNFSKGRNISKKQN